jgi:hypothetical protein
MTENRIFTLCCMITWVVFLRMILNFISSLPVKRGGSLSFLVRTISNVLVMEIGWTDVGSGGYILVSCAHSNTSLYRIPFYSGFSLDRFYCTDLTNHQHLDRLLVIYLDIRLPISLVISLLIGVYCHFHRFFSYYM